MNVITNDSHVTRERQGIGHLRCCLFCTSGYESNVVWKKHDMVIHLLTSMDRGLTNWFLRVLEKETIIIGTKK